MPGCADIEHAAAAQGHHGRDAAHDEAFALLSDHLTPKAQLYQPGLSRIHGIRLQQPHLGEFFGGAEEHPNRGSVPERCIGVFQHPQVDIDATRRAQIPG